MSNIIVKQSGQPFGVPHRFTLSSNCWLVIWLFRHVWNFITHRWAFTCSENDDESYNIQLCGLLLYAIRQFVRLLFMLHKDEIRKTGFFLPILLWCAGEIVMTPNICIVLSKFLFSHFKQNGLAQTRKSFHTQKWQGGNSSVCYNISRFYTHLSLFYIHFLYHVHQYQFSFIIFI